KMKENSLMFKEVRMDLKNEEKFILDGQRRNYKPTNVAIKNRGHDIMLRWICVCWNHLDQQY
ncbi:hypothetical protein FRX31_031616, partial [Thalictrum thalictroides]